MGEVERPWMNPFEVEARRRAAKEFCDAPANITPNWDALLEKHRREVMQPLPKRTGKAE